MARRDDAANAKTSWASRSRRCLRARNWTRETTAWIDLREELDAHHVVLDAYGRILSIAPAVAASIGFPTSHLVGRRFAHRVSVSSRNAFQTLLNTARITGSFAPFHFDLRTKDGPTRAVTLTFRRAVGIGNGLAMVVALDFAAPDGTP